MASLAPTAIASEHHSADPADCLLRGTLDFAAFRDDLLGMYARRGCVLERKTHVDSGGTAWGYKLKAIGAHTFEKATGASIGEDELRIFFDICRLIKPRHTFVVGNAFGLSTFAIAKAWPAGSVLAIDSWSEGAASQLVKKLNEDIVTTEPVRNATVFTGTSPQDNARALAGLQGRKLSLFFIDGMHTSEAALADFIGTLGFLDRNTVVAWHNVASVKDAFRRARQESHGLFNEGRVLRTYGQLGLYYNREAHPSLHAYIENSYLSWANWERYYLAASCADQIEDLLRVRYSLPGKVLARVLKFLPRRRTWTSCSR